MLAFLLFIYFVLLVVFSVFSYSLTAPNLILTNWTPYWNFQVWMWKTFFNDRPVLSTWYAVIVGVLFLTYLAILWHLKKFSFPVVHFEKFLKNSQASVLTKLTQMFSWQTILVYLIVISPLLFSNNGLSYDLFNYIFNAKMVMIYNANPHEKVALDFYYDDWTRFMHNTHTPAPYGYGWTALSLLPYTLGQGKFLATWELFRLFSFLSLGLLFIALVGARYQLVRSHDKENLPSHATHWSAFELAAIFLNPLLLIEVLSVVHNDLWMMAPAIAALALFSLLPRNVGSRLLATGIAGLLLAFSVSIKLATLTLLPVVFFLLAAHVVSWPWLKSLKGYWPLAASLCLFVPLFTLRSQQFHPWYLLWPLTWVPLFSVMGTPKKAPWLSNLASIWFWAMIVLSAASLARYYPYLRVGEFTPEVLRNQKLITWIPFGVSLGLGLVLAAFIPSTKYNTSSDKKR